MDSTERIRNLAAYYRDVLAALLQNAGKYYTDIGAVAGRGLVADLIMSKATNYSLICRGLKANFILGFIMIMQFYPLPSIVSLFVVLKRF
ncbi:MAG: hypothetical protein ACOY9Y_04125 [Bacillota bacterium]